MSDFEDTGVLDAPDKTEAVGQFVRPGLNTNKAVSDYIAIRDHRAALKKQFDEEDGKLKAVQEKICNALLDLMNQTGQNSGRTDNGTFYRQEKIIPTGADWEAFYEWVKTHNAFDALERRIKANFIKEYMESNDGAVPPGVSVYREYQVGVRRS